MKRLIHFRGRFPWQVSSSWLRPFIRDVLKYYAYVSIVKAFLEVGIYRVSGAGFGEKCKGHCFERRSLFFFDVVENALHRFREGHDPVYVYGVLRKGPYHRGWIL